MTNFFLIPVYTCKCFLPGGLNMFVPTPTPYKVGHRLLFKKNQCSRAGKNLQEVSHLIDKTNKKGLAAVFTYF